MNEHDPLAQLAAWLREAEQTEPNNPNAMALATASADGAPAVRMVLLKGVDDRGIVFYTNSDSRKGRELAANPRAAACVHWKSRSRQVRVEGAVEQVSGAEADAYFASRPRQAQIGAWASRQSAPMSGRFELEKRIASFALQFGIGPVPRPPFWNGYRILADRIEFWSEGTFRLHERSVYTRHAALWQHQTLYP